MIEFDSQLVGTPFRGLILQGFAGYCAYIGVPQEHWLADMEELEFVCHYGITFRGPGGDGIRPEGWYWYGWDYQHSGDKRFFPAEFLEVVPEELKAHLTGGKEWTVAEIEQDIMDAAMALLDALQAANGAVEKALPRRITGHF